MAKAIVIETTSRAGQIALASDGVIVAATEFSAGMRHAALLVAEIDRLCRENDWKPGDIDQVHLAVGPGSFTGTRIGVTFAKTFAFATGARIVAVPSATVIVENAPQSAIHAAVVLDARRGKVWAEAFRRNSQGWQSTAAIGLTAPADLLASLPRPVTLVGEGVEHHQAALVGEGIELGDIDAGRPRVQIVARIGHEMAQRREFAGTMGLVPLYVRRPEAEEQRLGLA